MFSFMEGRVINAETVTFLGAAAAFFLSQGSRNSSNGFRRLAYWALAGICLIVVLLSRQRTASTGVIVGLSAFFLLHPTLFGVKRTPRLLAACLVGVLFVVAVTAGDVLEVLPEEFRESLAKRDTLDARIEIWTEALAMYSRSDFWWQAFGRPTGVPLVLQLEAGEWGYSVHSAYVGLLMSYGIVGSLVWATLLLAALFAALRRGATFPRVRFGTRYRGVLAAYFPYLWLQLRMEEWSGGIHRHGDDPAHPAPPNTYVAPRSAAYPDFTSPGTVR